MALSFKVNQLTGPTTTGNNATTDPGFQPKGIMVLAGNQTSNGAAADAQFSLGMASSSTTEIVGGYNSDDAVAASDVSRYLNTSRLLLTATAGTVTTVNAANLTSLDATGFTPNWTTVGLNSALYDYLALGGTDITNVETGSFASNTATGNQAVVLAGSFQPDIVFLFATLQTASGIANNNSQYSFGVMTSSDQWSTAIKTQNSQATTNTSRAFSNTKCFTMVSTASNAVFQEMSYVSMNSNGFTVNIDTAGGTAILIGYMAIKGGQWKVGTDTQKTSTGTKATTGIGFTPKGLILASVCDTQTAGTADHSRFCLGFSDGTRNVALWTGDKDASADTVANTIMSNTKAIVLATEATGASPTTDAEASVDSFSSDTFTLNYSTADATARVIGYVAVGDTASATTTSTTTSTTTTSTSSSTTVSTSSSTTTTSTSTSITVSTSTSSSTTTTSTSTSLTTSTSSSTTTTSTSTSSTTSLSTSSSTTTTSTSTSTTISTSSSTTTTSTSTSITTSTSSSSSTTTTSTSTSITISTSTSSSTTTTSTSTSTTLSTSTSSSTTTTSTSTSSSTTISTSTTTTSTSTSITTSTSSSTTTTSTSSSTTNSTSTTTTQSLTTSTTTSTTTTSTSSSTSSSTTTTSTSTSTSSSTTTTSTSISTSTSITTSTSTTTLAITTSTSSSSSTTTSTTTSYEFSFSVESVDDEKTLVVDQQVDDNEFRVEKPVIQ